MRIITETFEGGHLYRFGSTLGINGGGTVVVNSSMDGARCYNCGGFDGSRGLPLTLNGSGTPVAAAEIFAGFYFMHDDPDNVFISIIGGSAVDQKHRLMSFWSGSTGICTVRIDPILQKLELCTGAYYWTSVSWSYIGNQPMTAVAASTQGQAIVENTLYHCQIRVKLDGANSIVQVKLDDTLVIDWTGTLSGSTMDRVMLHSAGSTYADVNGSMFIDNIVINDTTAATCPTDQTWPGVLRFKVQNVIAPGTYAQFTPDPGPNNYEMVDDLPHDGDATTNYALSAGLKDSFPTSPHGLAAADTTFRAWFQEVIARKSAGTFEIKLGVRRSGADYMMAGSLPLGVSYDVYDHRLCQDPSSLVNWTAAGLDATEIIYESA